MITKEIIIEFDELFRYSLSDFLKSYKEFLEIDFPRISAFYSAKIKNVDGQSFSNLQKLIDELSYIFSIIQLNNNMLTNFKWFDLLDFLEKIDSTLQKVNNSSKWLRSSITDNNVTLNPQVDVVLRQGETFESLSRTVLNVVNWDNDWVNVAIQNDITEEDYTSDGGVLLKVNFNNGVNLYSIKSVVDTITGENILGIDIDKKLTFEDDDLKVLTPKDTFIQASQIMCQLTRGACPELPNIGIQQNMFIGSNISSILYPSLVRQLSEIFKTDDTVKSITIKSIRRESDGVFIDFEIESKLSDLVVSSMLMS